MAEQVQTQRPDEYAARGLDHFFKEQYEQARDDFEQACLSKATHADWKDLLARAASNAANRYEFAPSTVPFDKTGLVAPAALALREPLNLTPMPSAPGLMRRLITSAKKIAGVMATPLFDLLVRVLGGDGQNESWRRWPQRKNALLRDIGLAAIRNYMNHHTLQDPYGGRLVGHQSPGQRRPEWTERYRTATGAWNTDNPMEGAAGTRFIWQGNELSERRDTTLDNPNPIEVANQLLRWDGKGERKTVDFLNLLAVGWIQFMVHDWVNHRQTDEGGAIQVPFPANDPRREKYGQEFMTFRRTQPSILDGNSFAYENEVTAWWDGSQIYGSDQFTQDRLRACDRFTWMKLLAADREARQQKRHPSPRLYDAATALARNGKLFVEDDQPPVDATTGVIDSGFTRNMWAGLDLFHTLFIRHHNWLCDCYAKENPEWSSDQIFNHARLENAATMAKIHTIEWTPAVLPTAELSLGMNSNWHGMLESGRRFEDRRPLRTLEPTHPVLGGLVGGELNNYGVPQNFSEQFVEVYRLHAAMPDVVRVVPIGSRTVASTLPTERTRAAGSRSTIRQLDAQFSNQGLATLINSLGHQHMHALVNNNYPAFMTEMSTEGAPMFDLAAADLVRARERGIPRFNAFRKQLGMPEVTSFDELTDCRTTVDTLTRLYGHGKDGVDRLDVTVGMLCDTKDRPLKGFDNTRFAIFLQAATRRLQTDPFFTEKYDERHYTKAALERIDRVTLKSLLLQHFPLLNRTGLNGVHNAFEPWGTTAMQAPNEHPLAAIERYRDPVVGGHP